jgi:cell division protein FtsX
VLTLCTLGIAISYFGLIKEQNRLASSLEITILLKQHADSSRIFSFASSLSSYAQIDQVYVISPTLAALEFEKQMQSSTFKLLPDNPFNWSISCTLKPEYCTYEYVTVFLQDIRKKNIVDQTIFNSKAAEALFARNTLLLSLTLAGAISSFLLFLGILSYVFRAEILQSPAEWFVLRTLGASRAFIAVPHVIFSIASILLGITIGGISAFLLAKNVFVQHVWIWEIPFNWILMSIGIMLVLSIAVSSITALTVTRDT